MANVEERDYLDHHSSTAFNQAIWPQAQIAGTIWSSLIEYGKLAWLKTRKAKSEKAQAKAQDHFESTWTINEYPCLQEGMIVHWSKFYFDLGKNVG